MFIGPIRQQGSLHEKVSTRVQRISAALVVAAGLLVGQVVANAQQPDVTAAKPILIELFTSEGCSSCPPDDELLQRMDASQPIPGAQLIVLSEHVDYWNHDGWKDPYSSPFSTERQAEYVQALGLKTPYTPQIIVDGAAELSGNSSALGVTLQKAAALPKVPVRITLLEADGGSRAMLRGRAEVEAGGEKQNAGIYAVLALDHAESQVLRGENSGKHLAHVAVVQEIKKIGKLEKGNSVTEDFQFKLKPGMEPTNLRVIVFVQTSGPGKVLGAALRKTNDL
jgi:hypothetical protein